MHFLVRSFDANNWGDVGNSVDFAVFYDACSPAVARYLQMASFCGGWDKIFDIVVRCHLWGPSVVTVRLFDNFTAAIKSVCKICDPNLWAVPSVWNWRTIQFSADASDFMASNLEPKEFPVKKHYKNTIGLTVKIPYKTKQILFFSPPIEM